MGDRALSMSLDDYIKSQRKGGAKGRNVKGKPGFANTRGGTLSQNHKQRYFSGKPTRGQKPQQRSPARYNNAGRGNPRQKQQNRPGNGENSRNRKQGQIRRPNNNNNNNRFVGKGQNFQRNNRAAPANSRLQHRMQRFGAGNVGTNQRQKPVPSTSRNPGNRNMNNRVQRKWIPNALKKSAGGVPKVARPRKNFPTVKAGPAVRVKNKRVQQLIRSRIQKARLILTKKPVVTTSKVFRNPVKRNVGRTPVRSVKQAIAQQRLVRARNVKSRNVKRGNPNRGLTLDRNQLVKVRVPNDLPAYERFSPRPQRGFYGPSSSRVMTNDTFEYSNIAHSEFPPYVLSNNATQSLSTGQVLDPEIQRKISIIQNRARHSRDDIEILDDFKGPVSACKMNPGDRFRMFMK